MAGIIVRPRARILSGHEWVYSSEIQKVYGDPADGAVVSLRDGRDRFLGSAIYNSRSTIAARRFAYNRSDLTPEFIEARIRRAAAHRVSAGCDLRACRVVWSESDGLPGVVLDRYGDAGVLQTLTLAMDVRKKTIAEIAARILDLQCVVERNDVAVRGMEGLESERSMLVGTNPGPVEIQISGLRFGIDLFEGHKTGLYLDQAASYPVVAKYAKGRRVLDGFSHLGGFALACAKAGASEIVAVESSAACVSEIRQNALRNEVSIQALEADMFEYLSRAARRGEKFDVVILDPPSFARKRGSVSHAMRGYRELHLCAAQVLGPGGILVTFCCSHHVAESDFLTAIREGLHGARRSARRLEVITQPADHPVLLSMPESEYLKGYMFEVIG